jgi:DnaK suppressor protein
VITGAVTVAGQHRACSPPGNSDPLDLAAASTGKKETLMTADLTLLRPPAAVRPDPAAQARHLHPAALPQWRTLLGTRWHEQLALVTQVSADYRAARAAARRGDWAARQRAAALRHQAAVEQLALTEIWDALVRLKAGRFGWCERCGTAIAAARLASLPQASCCPACES